MSDPYENSNRSIHEFNDKIDVYTTRPDTLFGFSFLAVSVDHPISKYFSNDPKFIKFRDEGLGEQ